jgi:hypothetical protein
VFKRFTNTRELTVDSQRFSKRNVILGVGKAEQKQSLKERQLQKKLNNYPKDDGVLSREELKERSQRVFTW